MYICICYIIFGNSDKCIEITRLVRTTVQKRAGQLLKVCCARASPGGANAPLTMIIIRNFKKRRRSHQLLATVYGILMAANDSRQAFFICQKSIKRRVLSNSNGSEPEYHIFFALSGKHIYQEGGEITYIMDC